MCFFCGEGIGHYQPWGVVPGCGYAHLNCNTSWDEFGYRLVAVPVSYDALQDQGC
jgi:hypothetical protein